MGLLVREVWTFLRRHFALSAALGLIAAQGAGLIAAIASVADHSAIVGAINDDAGNAVQVALRSQWWSNNDFFPYGPLYFRLANTLRQLAPWSGSLAATSLEGREAAVHFSMLLVSLLSLFALAATLATLLWSHWSARLLMAALLTAAFLHNPVWTKMLLTAHPDMLFSWLVVMALLASLRALDLPQDSRIFKVSAFLWGAVASTKLTIVLFVPALVLAFRKPALRHFAWMALGFFAIGFPQNFLIPKMIKFLLSQSRLSVAPGLVDIGEWLTLFADALWLPATVLLLGWVFLPARDDKSFQFSTSTLKRGMWIVVLPALWLMARKVLSPFDYYPMPFCALLLVSLALLLRRVPMKRWPRWVYALGFAGLFLFVRLTTGLVPPVVAETADRMQECRPESRAVYAKVKAWLDAGKKVQVDPYVPYPTDSVYKDRLARDWSSTWPTFESRGLDYALLRGHFYARYLGAEPGDYVKVENPEWLATRQFYAAVHASADIRGPAGQHWVRTSIDACQYEVWERKTD